MMPFKENVFKKQIKSLNVVPSSSDGKVEATGEEEVMFSSHCEEKKKGLKGSLNGERFLVCQILNIFPVGQKECGV